MKTKFCFLVTWLAAGVGDWQKVLASFDSNLNTNFAQQRKITAGQTVSQNKIDALQKQMNQIFRHSKRSVKNTVVVVQLVDYPQGTIISGIE